MVISRGSSSSLPRIDLDQEERNPKDQNKKADIIQFTVRNQHHIHQIWPIRMQNRRLYVFVHYQQKSYVQNLLPVLATKAEFIPEIPTKEQCSEKIHEGIFMPSFQAQHSLAAFPDYTHAQNVMEYLQMWEKDKFCNKKLCR